MMHALILIAEIAGGVIAFGAVGFCIVGFAALVGWSNSGCH